MRERTGFTLIEVLVGITLGGFLMALLISSVFQFVRSTEYLEASTDMVTQQTVVFGVMERDLSGMFVPHYIVNAFNEALGERDKAQEPKHAKNKQDVAPKEGGQAKQSQEDDKELFEFPPYVCKTERGKAGVMQFGFFTNNSPTGFWSEKVGSPQTRVAYVTYTLEPLQDDLQRYQLLRFKETPNFKKKKQVKKSKSIGDVLATNIARFDIEFLSIVPSDDPEKPPKLSRQDRFTLQPEKFLKQIKEDPDAVKKSFFVDAVTITITMSNPRGNEHKLSQLIMIGAVPTLQESESESREEKGPAGEQKKKEVPKQPGAEGV